MGQLERLRVFPVKGLDGVDLEATEILNGGTVKYDREFALFDTDGNVINGKRTDRIHALETDFDPASNTFHVVSPSGESQHFDLETERGRAAQWFSTFFGVDLKFRRDTSLGFVDRREMGPSVVSTATLETVAAWFNDMTVDGARRRLRANVEISGVPAFWEDRFVGENAPSFEIDGIRFEGVTPCGRCVVPQRDPDTGEPISQFRKRFIEKREDTFPDWADEEAFDHYYSLMIITQVPENNRGKMLRVGDDVTIAD